MHLVAHFTDLAGQARAAGEVAGPEESAAFTRWVDGLPEQGNEGLKGLRECGFAHDLAALEVQLRTALAGHDLAPGAQAVGQRLLDLLARRGDAACLLIGPGPLAGEGISAGTPPGLDIPEGGRRRPRKDEGTAGRKACWALCLLAVGAGVGAGAGFLAGRAACAGRIRELEAEINRLRGLLRSPARNEPAIPLMPRAEEGLPDSGGPSRPEPQAPPRPAT